MKQGWFEIIIASSLFLTACGTAEPLPTETPTITFTPEPTATATTTPTITPTATLRPHEIRLDEEVVIDSYFSVQIPIGFEYEVFETGLSVSDADGNTIIVMGVFTPPGSGYSPSLNLFGIFLGGFDNVDSSEVVSYFVDFYEAGSRNVVATTEDLVVSGRHMIVEFDNGLEFGAIGLSATFDGTDYWVREGMKAFTQILGSLQFDQSVDFGMRCRIAEDAEYGRSQDNPVRIGGDFLEGPARARAYFNGLADQNGDPIVYIRTGSRPTDDGNILDVYELSSFSGEALATIYVDQYSYETLYAPDGFFCYDAFRLEAP